MGDSVVGGGCYGGGVGGGCYCCGRVLWGVVFREEGVGGWCYGRQVSTDTDV